MGLAIACITGPSPSQIFASDDPMPILFLFWKQLGNGTLLVVVNATNPSEGSICADHT